MENNEEIKNIGKKIDELDYRISKIEEILSKTKIDSKIKETYHGLNGGIRFLIKNRFLDYPRTLKEIDEELKRLGYHYPSKSISKALLVDFMRNWRILTRIKENKNYKYVMRK